MTGRDRTVNHSWGETSTCPQSIPDWSTVELVPEYQAVAPPSVEQQHTLPLLDRWTNARSGKRATPPSMNRGWSGG
jgi:hypothetical protein